MTTHPPPSLTFGMIATIALAGPVFAGDGSSDVGREAIEPREPAREDAFGNPRRDGRIARPDDAGIGEAREIAGAHLRNEHSHAEVPGWWRRTFGL